MRPGAPLSPGLTSKTRSRPRWFTFPDGWRDFFRNGFAAAGGGCGKAYLGQWGSQMRRPMAW
jgi:hypothetical protein